MTKILRKSLKIKYKGEIAYCLTYNLTDNLVAKNIQWWVKEKYQNNFTLLYRIQQLIVGIKTKNENSILEKTLYKQLKFVNSFMLEEEKFNTEKAALSKKPDLDMSLITEKEIDEKLENYIKGE